MAFKIIWTKPALAALEELHTYIVADNPAAADRQVERILDHVELLGRFPHIGPALPDEAARGVRYILCGRYRLLYRVREDEQALYLITIWHGARQDPELPTFNGV